MTLEEVKKLVIKREELAHVDDMRIFYPDPVNSDDCAQCGKHKDAHEKEFDGKPFFCHRARKKSHDELMDEAAELYAEIKSKELSVIPRKILIEKYPHPKLKNILLKKYKAVIEKEYEIASRFRDLEVKFYQEEFGYDIRNRNGKIIIDLYGADFEKDISIEEKIDNRIKEIFQALNNLNLEKPI